MPGLPRWPDWPGWLVAGGAGQRPAAPAPWSEAPASAYSPV